MNFKKFLEQSTPMILIGDNEVSENLRYHLLNNISLCDNVFRINSESYFSLIEEVRNLYNKDAIALNDLDAELIETDIGSMAKYDGENIYLDVPFLEEKNPPLNKPIRTPGGPKKFKVYVKSPSGKVKMVRFGDSKSSGLSIKNSSAARAKSFRARHKCNEKKDKTTPGYWSCNIARYAKSVGLKSSRPW